MPVIAMTREMGSRGREVSERVAAEMGLALVLHELVEGELAERMQVPESAVHRRFEGGTSLRERWQVGTKRLVRHTAEEILKLARKGNVLIRGWGACVLLREIPHVARIRVCAPMRQREDAVIERQGVRDRSAARLEIGRNDSAHERILREVFGVDRYDCLVYDLVLNTERLSVETCARLVAALTGSADFQETTASGALLDDKILEAQIHVRLRERFTVGTGVSGVDVKVCAGRIVLTGLAIHRTLADEAGKIAGAVAGVGDVINRIEVVRAPRGL
jgi:cytidylate kinase